MLTFSTSCICVFYEVTSTTQDELKTNVVFYKSRMFCLMCACAFLACHMFQVVWFSRPFWLICSCSRSGFVLVSFSLCGWVSPSLHHISWTSVWVFRPGERRTGTRTLTECVRCLCVCVDAVTIHICSHRVCDVCDVPGGAELQWCVNKRSKFNLLSQVQLPSATADTHTNILTHDNQINQTNTYTFILNIPYAF